MSTPTKKKLNSIGFMGDVSHCFGFVIGKTVAVGDWIGRNAFGHLTSKRREQPETKASATVRADAQDRIPIQEVRTKPLAKETSARRQKAKISPMKQDASEAPEPAIKSVRKKSTVKRKKTKASVKKTTRKKVPLEVSTQPGT